MRVHSLAMVIVCSALLIGVEARAQQPAPPIEYGPTVTLDQARWVTGIILSIDAGSMAGTVGNTTPTRAFD